MITLWVLLIANSVAWLLPSPQDKHDWGLRVHRVSINAPLLTGEIINQSPATITLINFSKQVQSHDPLTVAVDIDDLTVYIRNPDGKNFSHIHLCRESARDPFTVQMKLKPGTSSSLDCSFKEFGSWCVMKPGRHTIEAQMKIDGKVITSPPIKFDVLDRKDETVLAAHAIPLEGYQLNHPVEQRDRPFIEQICAGGKTFLVYRRYNGPNDKYISTFRLAELPGKVEMKVEGVSGDRGPLTITYKTSPTAKPTKLVINSVGGTRWTEEDEKVYREQEKKRPTKP